MVTLLLAGGAVRTVAAAAAGRQAGRQVMPMRACDVQSVTCQEVLVAHEGAAGGCALPAPSGIA